jgi:hypothetical protein
MEEFFAGAACGMVVAVLAMISGQYSQQRAMDRETLISYLMLLRGEKDVQGLLVQVGRHWSVGPWAIPFLASVGVVALAGVALTAIGMAFPSRANPIDGFTIAISGCAAVCAGVIEYRRGRYVFQCVRRAAGQLE